ncbi:hypothetical protein V8G54_008748 [Vigna mungo]|uniref:Putative plant transposon protein domain-containing protein n=1 Tax=Vigna mungo TaxID=3915 RepID=A0AAQ3P5Q7_VIGMU
MSSSSNPKKVKTIGHKKDKRKKKKNIIFSHHFLSEKHEENFQVVQSHRLLMERKVEQLILEAPQFGDELERRHWLRLLHYPEPASIIIVKEFYANARHFSDGEEPFVSYFRGRRVPFDAATINTFLNTQWPEDTASCEFAAARANQFREVDFTDVERVLCIQGGHFYRNLHDKPLNIKRAFLQPLYKYWVVLLHANISPCSHVSDLIVSRAASRSTLVSASPRRYSSMLSQQTQKAPLGHPSLITYLCALAGVDTSEAPFKRPRATINRAYYTQYCLLDEEGLPIPPPLPPRRYRRRGQAPPQQPLGSDQPASHDPFMMVEMRDMMQRMEVRMETLHQMGHAQEARMEAINRIGRAQAEMMRQAFGASHPDFMTPAEYDAFVAWPGDQAPTAGGGGSSFGAQAMEEDGTKVEDVEDEEDDSEEDDSDAGMEILELDEDDSEEDDTEVGDIEDDEDEDDD